MESHGNQGPGLGQTHKYVEVKQVNGIPWESRSWLRTDTQIC